MSAPKPNPVEPFLQRQGVLVLDGGLATELEARGRDLSDHLWSARLLLDDPDLIRAVHLDYLRAGADCITSASYQATIEGLATRGLRKEEAAQVILSSVRLAVEAREEFWTVPEHRRGRLKPIVAASVGPYGAYLADGSEYTGRYDLDRAGLLGFHRERWRILAASEADLLACETIPSSVEAEALLELLGETPHVWAWFSFSCRDERSLSDGMPIARVAASLRDEPRVVAVGINCTPPRFIRALIEEVRAASSKPVVVYPNSGEVYDKESKRWVGDAEPVDFGRLSDEWLKAGATLIGGCCRTGPVHVRAIRERLVM
ncbi:MAG: homocysteine S-methyltransferase [Gemmatimonadales bacterium]